MTEPPSAAKRCRPPRPPRIARAWLVAALALRYGACPHSTVRAEDLAQLEQQAFKAAAAAVADCVVQIRTVGGLDQLDGSRLAQGPTTGLILTADGYIVSSAINFAQQPASVLVRLPDGAQRAAEIIGRDTNRMLVLLKVDAPAPLPTPRAASAGEVRVGDWAIALGRTYDPERVNVSVGVISAKNRMYGRAIQTDANASAANYGGPLVDLYGRVVGVLVPMAPQAPGAADANELAGAEFYDSGIAFAVPLADVLATLPRWIDQRDLKRGLLGVGMKDGNAHETPPEITAIWPRSPAAKAGWKKGDLIVAVDGKPASSQAALRFITSPRYAGDELEVTIRRGDGNDAEEIETKITLAAKLEPYRHAFLGGLPVRGPAADGDAPAADDDPADDPPAERATPDGDDDDAEGGDEPKDGADGATGVTLRAVWPGSPAEEAGLRAGDHIVRLGDAAVDSLAEALEAVSAHNPGDVLEVAARRGDQTLALRVTLAELPTAALSAEDLGRGEAADGGDGAATERGLQTFKLPELPQEVNYYLPAGEGPPPGVLVWLGDGRRETNEALLAAWRLACDRDRVALLMPEPGQRTGWTQDDLEFLARLLPAAISRFGADPRRVVVGGAGKGGQLAYALAFKGRKLVRGLAVMDSPLPRALEIPPNAPTGRLAVLSVETPNAPLTLLIRKDLARLADAGIPATPVIRRSPPEGDQAIDAPTADAIARWMDGLDRF